MASEKLDELPKLRAELEQEKKALEQERQQIADESEYLPWTEPGCHKREGQ